LQSYLTDAIEVPHVRPAVQERPGSGSGRPRCAIPLLVQLRLFGLSILHLSDDELCDMPVGDLLGLWLAHLDVSGIVHVAGQEETLFHAWCDQEDKKRRN
jgi:hypothetical protein